MLWCRKMQGVTTSWRMMLMMLQHLEMNSSECSNLGRCFIHRPRPQGDEWNLLTSYYFSKHDAGKCKVLMTKLNAESDADEQGGIACLRNDPRHLCGCTASHPRRGRAASLGEDGNSCYQDIEWLRPHYPEKRKTRRSRMETRILCWCYPVQLIPPTEQCCVPRLLTSFSTWLIGKPTPTFKASLQSWQKHKERFLCAGIWRTCVLQYPIRRHQSRKHAKKKKTVVKKFTWLTYARCMCAMQYTCTYARKDSRLAPPRNYESFNLN